MSRNPLSLLQVLTILFLLSSPTSAQSASETKILPPSEPWDGASRELVAAVADPWITPAEASGLTESPTYDETVAWLRRLVDASPKLAMTSFGRSAEGRELWLVIASDCGCFDPEAMRAGGKPILLAQSGIHPGEIDGKDAGMMLLRELVFGSEQELLKDVNFLFVPIFNVDGHERRSPYGRINQRGPAKTGWRTDARNRNFNRDFTKADAPEMRAMLRLLTEREPDLYVDLHVTDGVDYQYDISWGAAGEHAYSPAAARWLREHLDPPAMDALQEAGHVPSRLILAVGEVPTRGILDWTGSPRFSDGYGSARHLPTILVENHSLKPYDRRVLGTYVMLRSFLRTLAKKGAGLQEAIEKDRARRPDRVTLTWKAPDGPPPQFEFLGIDWRKEPSKISGGEKVVWTGEKRTFDVPLLGRTVADLTVERPAAYLIPPSWHEVIERLDAHGFEMERFDSARDVDVEMYRFSEAKLAESAFEGRVRVSAQSEVERGVRSFPAGTVRVSTDQPLGELAVLLLEPGSPDGLFQWGFFHGVLQRTEYVEGYVMEPMAEAMSAEDPKLREAFEKKLAEDPEFAASPRARLWWFYQRTPFFDQRWNLYPVARVPR